jgi:starch phosphorylase
VVFVENYEMDVASQLVLGVDVWLNNPRRPLEASGTSGMKAGANGAINVSVLDGWWDEAAAEHIGWSIGNGEVYDDPEVQDEIESSALYDLLEHEIVPLFYDRGRDGLPRGWIRMMKEAMKGICPVFNTNRMVAEYAERCYFPALSRGARLAANNQRGARDLTAWRKRVESEWPSLRVVEIRAENVSERAVGQTVTVSARVRLSALSPTDVQVQLYHGEVNSSGDLVDAESIPMALAEGGGDGTHWYRGEVPCLKTGHRGYTVRVLPSHPDLATPFLPGLIRWMTDPIRDDQRVSILV